MDSPIQEPNVKKEPSLKNRAMSPLQVVIQPLGKKNGEKNYKEGGSRLQYAKGAQIDETLGCRQHFWGEKRNERGGYGGKVWRQGKPMGRMELKKGLLRIQGQRFHNVHLLSNKPGALQGGKELRLLLVPNQKKETSNVGENYRGKKSLRPWGPLKGDNKGGKVRL